MQIPPQYKDVIQVDAATGTYAPHVWFNEFWLLRDYLAPVNASLAELTLHFELGGIAAWKYMLMSQVGGFVGGVRGGVSATEILVSSLEEPVHSALLTISPPSLPPLHARTYARTHARTHAGADGPVVQHAACVGRDGRGRVGRGQAHLPGG